MQFLYNLYIGSSGYSIAAQDYLRAIQHVDPDFNLKVGFINGTKRQSGVSDQRLSWLTKLKRVKEEKHISIQHCIPPLYLRDRAVRRFGFAIFETIDPPAAWVSKMNEMDEIVTASHFNQSSFAAAGVKVPVSVVPHCFDPRTFHKDVQHSGRYNLFTFLYIATFRERKNFPLLIKAFYDAFSEKDHVCLLLKTDKSDALNKLVRSTKEQFFKSKNTAPVYIENRTFPFEEMPSFMKKADVYISVSRGEGFSIPNLHAMALNVPLITVKFGGSLEFAKPEMCTYIEPAGYKSFFSTDGVPQFKNKIWPEITVSEVRDKLIFAHKSYSHLKEVAAKGYDFVHQHFNYDIVGRRFIEVLREN